MDRTIHKQRDSTVTTAPSTLYVDDNLGTDGAGQGAGSGSSAYKTLGYAISSVCANARTINVAAGTIPRKILTLLLVT